MGVYQAEGRSYDSAEGHLGYLVMLPGPCCCKESTTAKGLRLVIISSVTARGLVSSALM